MTTQWTRRSFLKVSITAGGGLLIGSYVTGCATDTPTPEPTIVPPRTTPVPTAAPTATPVPEPPFQPNLFIRIDPDGQVTLTIHRSEMGQGVRTALAMILAEELEADWQTLRIEQALANNKLPSQITGGSGSIADNYADLRNAGATARELLIAAAAQTWNVNAADCKAENGFVTHAASGNKLGYGELVKTAKDIKLQSLPQTKDRTNFKLIGTSVPRIDGPDIVTGKAVYGLDVRIPNMLYAVVARCPVPGGKVASYDDAQAKAVTGVKAVVQVPSGVAVLAENTWAAIQGRAALQVTWDEGDNAVFSSESIRQQLKDSTDNVIAKELVEEGLTTLEAVYETPYLAHAPMEPVNCVADVQANQCTVWAPTQNPGEVQTFVQNAVGVPTTVNVTLLGGGFGRRLEVDYAIEAAQVSKAAGVPVQVVWTRDDDLQHDYYRQPTYHWLRAGWTNAGDLALWRHFVAGPGLNGIAYRVGKEVLEDGMLVPYEIPGRRAQSVFANIPLPTGPWRAVVNGPNAFANECFFDEVAVALNKDPYEFRVSLLREGDRMKPVLELAATKAGWGTPLLEGQGRGIACHTYHQTSAAMVAEVTVGGSTGAALSPLVVRVNRIVCALDCGTVVHPDMVAQQMEGCVAFALTSLLKGEITFEAGRVQQSNFNDYPLLQLSEMPQVEVYTVQTNRAPLGVGEMGVPPLVPAVLNAVFAATGIRIRHTPIRAEDLQASA